MQSDYFVLLLFFLIAIIVRIPTFFPFVIDHDESTYLVIADQILHGKSLYIDAIDLKPPGIFWVLAGFQAVFGKSIFFVRLLAAVLIAITAFLLFKVKRKLGSAQMTSIAAGLLYLVFASFHFSIAVNTEHFMNVFVMLGLYFFVRDTAKPSYFMAGLIIGLSFLFKYLTLLDFTAFLIFFFLIEIEKVKKWQKAFWSLFPKYLLASIAFLLPFALVHLYFYLIGDFEAFRFIVYEAPGNYANGQTWYRRFEYFMDYNAALFILNIPFYIVLFSKPRNEIQSRQRLLAIIWFIAVNIAIQLPGQKFSHYWLQLALPVCFLASNFFELDYKIPLRLKKLFKTKLSWIILFLLLFIGTSINYQSYTKKRDIPQEMYAYLLPKIEKNDQIYAANYGQILYYLLDKAPLNPYIHTSLLIAEKHVKTLAINVENELENIKQIKPRFIILESEYKIDHFQSFIENNYSKTFEVKNHYFIYELNL